MTSSGFVYDNLYDEEHFEVYPPDNFTLVHEGVYRSSFPKKKNFEFLKKLKLKSVLTLILEEYPTLNMEFLKENGIKFYQFGVAGNKVYNLHLVIDHCHIRYRDKGFMTNGKEPFVDIPEDTICRALTVLLDKRNHPILIHCNKGCLRKIQHWTFVSIFDEYRKFSHPKSRSMDQQFIELFDTSRVQAEKDYLPDWPEIENDEFEEIDPSKFKDHAETVILTKGGDDDD